MALLLARISLSTDLEENQIHSDLSVHPIPPLIALKGHVLIKYPCSGSCLFSIAFSTSTLTWQRPICLLRPSFQPVAQGLAKNSDAFVEGMDEQLLHLFLGAMDGRVGGRQMWNL